MAKRTRGTRSETAPMVLHRDFEITIERPEQTDLERDATGDGAGSFTIAISSEAPVERYDFWTGERYYEVLDHSGAGAVDLSYARDGLPFLLDHQLGTQVGLVENVRLEKDRRIRGEPRPGNHPDASWVFADIAGGIRKKISVGYDPGRNFKQVEGKGDQIPTRIYSGWRIYEASTVAVPADYDVGVMRSAFEGRARPAVAADEDVPAAVVEEPSDHSREAKREKTMADKGEGAVAAAAGSGADTGGGVTVTVDHDAERKQRNKELVTLHEIAKKTGLDVDLASAMARDLTPAAFAEEIHQASAERAKGPVGQLGLSEGEQRQYSVVRAMAELTDASLRKRPLENRLEFEISDDIAKRLGQRPKGFYVPMGLKSDRSAAAAGAARLGMTRTAVTGNIVSTTSLGGVGVETGVQSMIEILRNSSVLRAAGIRTMDGLTGDVLFPRQTGANTWTWEGENPATAKSLTAATFDSFTLQPHTGFGATAYSKQLLIQASYDVEQFVREDLAAIASIGIDYIGLNGLTTSNQPTGIFALSNTGSVLFATNGAAPTWAKIVEFETTASTANALQGRMAYVSTPGIRGYLKTNLKNTVSGADYLMNSNDAGLNGYPAFFTNQVRTNFTAGTSTTVCHGVVFGNWAEGIIATWGDALDITVDPYTYLTQGMIRVVETAMVDYGWRHPASFVVATSALTA